MCAGDKVILMDTLKLGAMVEISLDDEVLGNQEVPDEEFTFHIPADKLPLTANSKIGARQSLCDQWSDEQITTILAGSGDQLEIQLLPPLYACASFVHIDANDLFILRDLIEFTVWSEKLGASIAHGYKPLKPKIPVYPNLIEGDKIWITGTKCNGEEVKTNVETVLAYEGELPIPNVQAAVANNRAVKVTGVIPGAIVDVFVNNVWRESGIPDADNYVHFPGPPLAPGQEVQVRQRLCNLISELSGSYGVWVRPVAKVTTDPNPPEGVAPLKVKFINQSTGEIKGYEWDFNYSSSSEHNVDSTAHSPTNDYGNPGDYQAALRVLAPDSEYNSWDLSQKIKVSEKPPDPPGGSTPRTGSKQITFTLMIGPSFYIKKISNATFTIVPPSGAIKTLSGKPQINGGVKAEITMTKYLGEWKVHCQADLEITDVSSSWTTTVTGLHKFSWPSIGLIPDASLIPFCTSYTPAQPGGLSGKPPAINKCP